MTRILVVSFLLALGAAAAAAQTAGRTVQATGSATILATPDQAQIDLGVVTNGATAQDSAQQNATMTTAVLAALKSVLGSSGTVQTVSYYVTPRYSSATGQSNVLIGYTTTNTVRVTTTDLSIIGKLIDAANQAGANSVGNLSFGLQDPEPKVQQALTQATKQAMTHAAAIAAGLGATLGPVVTALQDSSYTPVVLPAAAGGGAATTPVQTGTVSVYASVTVTAQLQ
ncbi:MAG TPA: SIMPL domain-containing protein [Candidatus Acidoferrales bacterium]|nr:SIMPL domain-containing protein [Bryobacteraceae bacterium]HTS62699.1 SIMPL domain-containing protein [Candidatus Acidoferrales bacterium]